MALGFWVKVAGFSLGVVIGRGIPREGWGL